ncbi:preprotein translocase subunit SecG [Hyunsoonleella flava]|uniref:Protein-export membrane protein SecG n=1 Tax=Hyunsoonleella flava TaxID=2527939 RepID=A0A4Q9FIN8_9FLAO|nr:preprotein translocase subunit SecG [Hyunsoonleella flava]TBN02727.1 preprotein translocase subunit SecG [Hyunsoonleella flava]
MGTFTIFLILIVVVAFLLVVVIMVQNPKGGGLSSSFGGGGTQQLGGVKKTTDFLDKSTWTLATLLLVLILVSNVAIGTGDATVDSKALDTDAQTTQPLPDAQPLPANNEPAGTTETEPDGQ